MPQRHMPKVAIVLVGTNDLFAEADCIADNTTALEESVSGIFKRLAPLCCLGAPVKKLEISELLALALCNQEVY